MLNPNEAGQPITRGDMEAVEIRLNNKIDQAASRLDQKIDRIAVELVRTQADLQAVKTNMATKEDISRIFNAIDKFAQKAVVYDHKALSHGDILTNHESRLREHDRRLGTLEGKA